MTTDLKSLLRQGIPISQRGSVWKAIVDHKLNLKNDKFETDYYKKLLANYNPSRNLTPAAKQVYTQSLIQAPHISNTFETGQNLGKIKQSTGVFKKKIEKISNNSNTSKQR